MITADTITDEQIRVLRREAVDAEDMATAAACSRALNAGQMWATHDIQKARARCAEILNARGGR